MENSSKILIISAVVLIVLILISLGIILLKPSKDTTTKVADASEQMKETNQKTSTNIKNSLDNINRTGGQQKTKDSTEPMQRQTEHANTEQRDYVITGDDVAGKIFQETIEYKDLENNTAWIPKGFGIVKGCTTINDGLVISDAFEKTGESSGNEFVWVPVEINKTTDSKTRIEAMDRTLWQDNQPTTSLFNNTVFQEPYASGYEGEDDEYEKMLESVYNHGGFYIGRYEAGSEKPRYNRANGTTVMSVKKGKYPYVYVGWGPSMNKYEGNVTYNSKDQGYGAVKLCKDLYYNDPNVGVVSTLVYGSQWDATLRFIKSSFDVTDSASWGNCKNSETFAFNGEYYTNNNGKWKADKTQKEKEVAMLLQTGASDRNKTKNIYDLEGNAREWTMEAYSNNGTKKRCSRGSNFNYGSGENYPIAPPASYRHFSNASYCGFGLGFRPALYIV